MQSVTTCLAACGILIALAGCGRVDSGAASFFPDIVRDKAPQPVVSDPAPDIRALLKSDLNAVFLAASAPTNVSFSAPKPAYAEWTTCVRASVSGATGRSIGQQTYLVNILHGKVNRRERISEGHWCTSERYELL
jgi:hypothetical protein